MSDLTDLDVCRIKPNKDKTMDTEGKVWAISQRLHKVLSNWSLFWRLGEFEDNPNCPLIPCWGGSPSTKGTMDWCEEECMDLLGLPQGATMADRVAAYTSAPVSVKRACQNALKECKEYAFSRQPSSADINNAYSMIFDPDNKITTLDTPVHITTQKWRAITFTASVLIWKRDAAGGGQPTPGMMGLAGARHPARMCKDMHEVKVSVSAAAGTSGANADVNYMLVPWPELCDADARTHIAAEQHGSSACGENDSTEEDETPHPELADAVLSQHGSPTCGEDTSIEEQHTALAYTPESAAAPAFFEPSMSAAKQTKKRSKAKDKGRHKKKDKERKRKSKKRKNRSASCTTTTLPLLPQGTVITHDIVAEFDSLFGTGGQGDSAKSDAYYDAPSSKSARWARVARDYVRAQRSG